MEKEALEKKKIRLTITMPQERVKKDGQLNINRKQTAPILGDFLKNNTAKECKKEKEKQKKEEKDVNKNINYLKKKNVFILIFLLNKLIQNQGTSESNTSNKSIHYEFIKPIMFSAGIGLINDKHLYKKQPKENMLIIRIGGPAYKIGLGGGFSSSSVQNT